MHDDAFGFEFLISYRAVGSCRAGGAGGTTNDAAWVVRLGRAMRGVSRCWRVLVEAFQAVLSIVFGG